jgi:hypothetical protein
VSDTVAPQFQFIPATINATCLEIPLPSQVCLTDNCAVVTIAFSETTVNQACVDNVLYKLVRRSAP